jgi:conjugative transfer region protein TrbK
MSHRLRLKDLKRDRRHVAVTALVRFAAIAIVAVIVIIAIGEASRTNVPDLPVGPALTERDPLAAALLRCRTITAEQLAADDSCRRAWAESRRRFFAPRMPNTRTPEAESKSSDKMQDRVPDTPMIEVR